MRGRISLRPYAIAIAAFVAGLAMGRLTALPGVPATGHAKTDVAAAREASDRLEVGDAALEEALADSWLTILRLSAEVDSLESLLQAIDERDVDPVQAVRTGIERMSDEQLESIVASAVHLSPEELAEVGDVRAFANRLAEVAMDGVIEPGRENTAVDRVALSATPAIAEPSGVRPARFEADQKRIYAFFPTDGYARDQVMVKWYRRDAPRILLFRRYPIEHGEPYGYVWVQARQGWDPGEYQVDVYTADEDVTLLSTGRYTIARAD